MLVLRERLYKSSFTMSYREKGRFERGASGFGARSSAFEEGPTSPRKEFSRSMSSDNWRELRNKGKEEEEEEGGDWRRAGPRDKWSE